jgi:4-amino-4-deoxy-L-arabinose transferase-like glycosyltransferase
LVSIGVRSGRLSNWESSLVAGDYHSGPLSLYIPFGSVGVLAFLLFLIASIRVLHQNWQYGDPRLKNINTFLLSIFLARAFSFVFIFGSISSDFYVFTGLIGFSVALNGGCKKAPTRPPSVPVPASA